MTKAAKDIFIQGAISPAFIAASIEKHQDKTGIGGHSIFLGQVRADVVGDRSVTAIEYSAYTDMALDQMQQLREEMIGKYQLTCMHVYHSLGTVHTGSICLFVFTSASHRKAAIDSCEEVVERLKKELPIWGKEILTDNSFQWKENR